MESSGSKEHVANGSDTRISGSEETAAEWSGPPNTIGGAQPWAAANKAPPPW